MLNSLRIRLTLIFVGLTIIPLVVVGYLIAQRGQNTLQDQSVEFQDELAQRVALSVEAFFNEHQAELTTLTDVYGLDTLDQATQRDIFVTLLRQEPAYYQLALVDADGNETLRVTREQVITENNLSSRVDDVVFQTAMETQTTSFGSVYFNETARDRLIPIAIPIEDLFLGEIGQVLVADIRFQNVGDVVLRELDLAEGEDIFIVDSAGTVLVHRNPNLEIRETVFDLPESNGRTTGLDGSDVILARHTIQLANQEIVVVAETSFENATALATELTDLAAIITISSLIIASAIVIFAVTRIVNPIIGMAKVATSVQQGDLTARANEKGRGEIATLGRAFNQMTSELQRSLEGLKHHVEQLETSNQERDKLIKDLQTAKRIADENSRLKSEFLATMSHELRTPLNAIEGFTSIMLSGMGVELSPRAEDMIKRVSSNSKRLLQLINDFLDLSRIEAGRMELVNSPLTIAELADKWRNEVGVLADEKGLDFVVSIDPELPETIMSDEDALSKVAMNLLSNAFKFTKEGKVSLDFQRQNGNWAISVSDTGIGIPPHAREFIFDEFRQVDGSSKRLYGGTGLGLSLVQKLSRALGGSVALQSEVGKGSTFIVTLPLEIIQPHEEGVIA